MTSSNKLRRLLAPVKRSIRSGLKLVNREVEYDFESASFRLKPFLDLSRDQWFAARTILGRPPGIVFDVGANTGATALELSRRFPRAQIHSFEPTPDIARSLRANVAHLPNVRVHEIALGDTDTTAEFHVNRMSETNSLLSTHSDSANFNQSAKMQETIDVIEVPVRTITSFCDEQAITYIDILKTDAQGYDLKIIEGAADMFGVIPIIYAEATFVRCYNGQPTFGAFHDRMNDLGYKLVDLYETGFRTRYYQLSCNALFVREDVPGPKR